MAVVSMISFSFFVIVFIRINKKEHKSNAITIIILRGRRLSMPRAT